MAFYWTIRSLPELGHLSERDRHYLLRKCGANSVYFSLILRSTLFAMLAGGGCAAMIVRDTAGIIAQLGKPLAGNGVDLVLGLGRSAIYKATAAAGFDLDAMLRAAGYTLLSSPEALRPDTARAIGPGVGIALPRLQHLLPRVRRCHLRARPAPATG